MRKFFNRKKLGTDPELPSSTFPTHINTNPTSSNVRNKVNLFEAPLNNQLGLGLQIPNEHRNGSAHSLNDRPSNTKQKSTLLTDVAPLDLATSSPNDSRDKRQVAFVSPANTSLNSPPSPPLPLPSLPSNRPPAGASGPSGASRPPHATNSPSFHHPPASLTSPHRTPGAWRSDSSGGVGSNVGSAHGHTSSHDSAADHDRGLCSASGSHRTMSPVSFMSSNHPCRRGSGGVIVGPADTWGGNLIGGRLGEDIYQPMTWSEMTDLDLVENLSGRERTRQEVLWEIVASEERYVSELVSLRNNYISPLLHPLISSIPKSPPSGRANSPYCKSPLVNSAASSSPTITTPPLNGSDFLPIAARFKRSPSPSHASLSNRSQDNIPDMESEECHQHLPATSTSPTPLIASTQSHQGAQNDTQSAIQPNQSSTSVNLNTTQNNTLRGLRQYLRPPVAPNKLHKQLGHPSANGPVSFSRLQKAFGHSSGAETSYEFLLPESLRIVFNVIDEAMFRGHEDLSVQLKAKYLEQFPLVRDLTSVWAEQTWIIQAYSTYVMHLERALKDVEAAIAAANPKKSGVTKAQKQFAKIILQLEENASSQGECGLAICLSKPFQRLLKYPLLFQNLLYHTDAATHEYESAQAMAISIDSIVRSIEDEKISEEERDKARDVWSRIEGINEKALMVPQSDRLLMSEESLWKPVPGKEKRTLSDAAEGSRTPTPTATAPEPCTSPVPSSKNPSKSTHDRLRLLKGQKSFRRLSDMMGSDSKEPNLGSKRDIWLIVFSDVVLRCQRVGVTRMSPSSFFASKDKKKMRRSLPGRERNLYKFLNIERWEKHSSVVLSEANRNHEIDMAVHEANERAEDLLSINEREARAQTQAPEQSHTLIVREYERMRRESEMSFSYELDEPKPVASNVLRAMVSPVKTILSPPGAQNKASVSAAPSNRLVSPTTHSVIAKRTTAVSKFSNRVPAGNPLAQAGQSSLSGCGSPTPQRSNYHTPMTGPNTTCPTPQYRYETPTTSTLAKKMQVNPNAINLARCQSPPPTNKPVGRRRAGSIGQTGTQTDLSTSRSRRRSDSTGPPSPPSSKAPAVPSQHKARSRNSATPVTVKRNFHNNSSTATLRGEGRSTHQNLQAPQALVKQPSEDFSAFKSYFEAPINSTRGLAFPTA